ncbi:MAG: hypothetical protein WB973_13380 [Thermoanaerobaculia bacterium]
MIANGVDDLRDQWTQVLYTISDVDGHDCGNADFCEILLMPQVTVCRQDDVESSVDRPAAERRFGDATSPDREPLRQSSPVTHPPIQREAIHR